MRISIIKALIIGTLIFISNVSEAQSQKFGMAFNYTTEVQHNFKNKANFLNMLILGTNYRPWQNGTFSLQTISNYKTNQYRVVNDIQHFSNIETDNVALNIYVLGYTHVFRNFIIAGGVRNLDGDYFMSDYALSFTNSSAGGYPTISFNFPVAMHPYTTVCVHGEYTISKNMIIKSSFYNGAASSISKNARRVFSFDFKNDGIFSITEFGYLSKQKQYSYFRAGFALHSNYNKAMKQGLNYTAWVNIEQAIHKSKNKEVGFLVQGSLAPSSKNTCSAYYGLGGIFKGLLSKDKRDNLAFFVSHAKFSTQSETAVEITLQYSLLHNLIIQPTFHQIKTGEGWKSAGIFRMYYTLP